MATNFNTSGRVCCDEAGGKRPHLYRYREALLGSVACISALAAATLPAAAACDSPVTANGILIIQCSGTITSKDAPAVSYSSTTDPFEILSSATISTTGANAYGIYGYGEGPYVLINSTGSVRTTGDNAHGVVAVGRNTIAVALFDGSVVTLGAGAHGIYTTSTSQTFGNSGILSIGSVSTSGDGAHGLYSTTDADGTGPTVPTGSIIRMISEGNITTKGNDARGV